MKLVFKNLAMIVSIFAVCALFTSCEKENSDTKSSDKQITAFSFATPPAVGVINESAKTIAVEVPQNTDVTALVPTIAISSLATVNPASGVVQNFTNPVTYTVTAEDGSTATYIVTVAVGGNGGGTIDPTELPSGIDANTTLPDLGLPVDYVINGTFNVNGNALLTIEPGVTIMFTGTNGGINVSYDAGLKMVGTPDKPIVLTGPANNPNKGSWEGIRIRSNRADNEFEYVQMINGGSGNSSWSALVVLYSNAKLSMKNCLIDGSLRNGVDSEGGGIFTAFEGNTIRNCDYYPVYSEGGINPYRNMTSNNTFSGNNLNYAYISGAASSAENMTLNRLSIPYYFYGGMDVNDNVTFTIAPGTTLLLGSGKNIDVNENAIFIAEGTAADRITIRGFEDEPGYMGHVRIRSTRNGNKLNYCDISGGGKASGWSSNNNIYLYSGVRMEMRNTTISKSYWYGVGIENPDNLNLTHENVTFSACEQGNVWYEKDNSVHEQLP